MPGNNGGANWGGAAVDPTNGSLFVVSKDLPAMLKLAKDPEADKALAASAGERFYTGFGFMIASDGLSPIAPPWTSLTAYDLNEGTIKWKIPLGEVPELAAKGFKNTGSHYPKVGPVVTAGGLIFTGTRDQKVRAFDAGHRQGAVGARSWTPRWRECRPYTNRGPAVHRVLRLGAGRADSGDASQNRRRIRGVRVAEGTIENAAVLSPLAEVAELDSIGSERLWIAIESQLD